MMVPWGALAGAVIGWLVGLLTNSVGAGLILGGAAGALAGWMMRTAVRAEVARAVAPLREELERLAALAAVPMPIRPAAPAAPTASERAAAMPAAPAPAPRPVAEPEPAAAEADAPGPVFQPSYQPGPRAPAEPTPAEPTLVETAIAAARGWLLGGNTIVRLGLAVLFVGLSFLASYAAQAGLFPIELRLALVAAIGIALLALGFRARAARPGFGLALQGGGVAVIYLTLFAAARLFDVASLPLAFALMVAVCALGCALALLQNAQSLALTAFAGGFAVPLLLGDEGGSAAALFAYVSVLNIALLFIAGRRAWRLLNLLGFFATLGIGLLWAASSYTPEAYPAAQAFLILSVVVYVAAGLLYARRTPGPFGGAVDATLLFGPAVAGFGCQAALVADRPFGAAFSALGFAALYLATAALAASRRRAAEMRVMNEAMLAVAVGFVTLAVPLALGARWTSAAWALEGAGAFWVGARQARWLPRLFGLALIAVAAAIHLFAPGPNIAALPFANGAFLGAMVVAAALLLTAWQLRAPLGHGGSRAAAAYAPREERLARPLFLAGFGFWWLAFAHEAARRVPAALADQPAAPVFTDTTGMLLAMLAFVASAWGAQWLARRLRWPAAAPARGTIFALALGFGLMLLFEGRLLHTPNWAIWLAAAALHLHALRRSDADGSAGRLPRAAHVGGVWLGVAALADALALGIDRAALWDTAWAAVLFLIAGTAVLAALALWAAPALRADARPRGWPLRPHAADYAWTAATPLAALLWFAAFGTAVFAAGDARPLPYLPLLNPVDLAALLAIGALALWRQAIRAAPQPLPGADAVRAWPGLAALALLAFALVNGAWLRAAHGLLGVAWDGGALLGDPLVQTGLAILWALLALALMALAHRRADRPLWLTGAALLGLTVAKLLLVDLANIGGGARVVAFMGVGALMLVIGYVAPLPPRAPAREAEA